MAETLGYRPLYRQVRETLLRRIAEGRWAPGATVPNEHALALELGVSQGTVRKALDSLAAENLVERRQGKGTTVAEVTPARSLFKFFRIARPGGERVTPKSEGASTRRRKATREERAKLKLDTRDLIVEISRIRAVDGSPAIRETIVVPLGRFPDLDRRPIPNTIYALYQSGFGVNVVSANEELKAAVATREDAKALDVPAGSPLLEITRIAFDIDGKPVELRLSRCDTRRLVYAVTLR